MLTYNECYHGTSFDNYLSIVASKKFTYKKRDNHWLGQGVYFFIEDSEKAKWFVNKSNNPNVKGKRKCVIKVSLNIENEKLLNLDTELGRRELEKFRFDLAETAVSAKSSLTSITNAKLRCLIIDAYILYYKMHAVKYTFSDDKIVYRGLNSNANEFDRIQNNGTQINVVNQSIINFDDLIVECI